MSNQILYVITASREEDVIGITELQPVFTPKYNRVGSEAQQALESNFLYCFCAEDVGFKVSMRQKAECLLLPKKPMPSVRKSN